ncbi:MAG: protein kinase [Bryobacteraceae bacterium]
MSLAPGDKLGAYEVTALLGAGGMGEVYKARDTRLDRSVAIKVLPDHIAQRDDARARFEREARAVASLNHPHICTLHDIGPNYMVMELIEGETLAARIEKGPIPLEQALGYATQIADALDRAHRAGVTHRDVKPQNIMLTRDGVKVLDFGLAKSAPTAPGPSEATLTKALTTEGTVLGTPQYMAPEQFEGKEADARSDIWAFGAVLYEMVTGRKAFEGKTYTSLVGAILSADPAPMALKPFTPAWLERLVQRCLAKDPDDRWQSIRDVVIELRSPPAEAAAPMQSKIARWPALAAAVLAGALAVAGAGWYSAIRPEPLRPLIRLDAEVAAGAPLARQLVGGAFGGNMLALSPDGRRLVLTMRGADKKVRLHTRLLDQTEVMPLAGTENAYGPFFSPAGDWIGFFADGKLRKIAVDGGTTVTLCDAPAAFGGTWGDDGSIIAALNVTGSLSRIPSAGGKPVPVTTLSPGEVTHRWPEALPGSQAVLFTSSAVLGRYDAANISVVSLTTGERKTLDPRGFYPRFLASETHPMTGHLVYLNGTTLFAVPFDPVSLTSKGAPAPILEDVTSTPAAGGDFAVARNGTFAHISGKASLVTFGISWLDRSGKADPLLTAPGLIYPPRFSPDGKRLAFSIGSATGSDLWVRDLDRNTTSRLSFRPGRNEFPVWSPDGKVIVFQSTDPAAPGLYAVRSDGSGEAGRLSTGDPIEYPYSFSPDGKHLAFHGSGNDGSWDIFTMPVEADTAPDGPGVRLGKPELFVGTPAMESGPRFSPDGRWLAYHSAESGMPEVYVRSFPGPGGRWQVSKGGGVDPVWLPDGQGLFFLTPEGQVLAVDSTARGDTFVASEPRVWTETRVQRYSVYANYDVAPDGKRLAVIVPPAAGGEKPVTHLTFLLNFFDELQRKAPGK